jgi:hypothetical protein
VINAHQLQGLRSPHVVYGGSNARRLDRYRWFAGCVPKELTMPAL